MLSQNGLIREEVEAVLRDHESEIEVRSLGSLGSLVTLYGWSLQCHFQLQRGLRVNCLCLFGLRWSGASAARTGQRS